MRLLSIVTLSVAVCVWTAGCDDQGDNYLEGSIADSYDLDFDKTRARLFESELSIEYVDGGEQGEMVALRVTLSLRDGPLSEGVVYDLKAEGSVSRGQGMGSDLPDLESGEIELDEYSGKDGSKVKGTFKALFVTSDNTRKNLRGGFSAVLEVVQ